MECKKVKFVNVNKYFTFKVKPDVRVGEILIKFTQKSSFFAYSFLEFFGKTILFLNIFS